MLLKKLLRTNACLSFARSLISFTDFERQPVLSQTRYSKQLLTLFALLSCLALMNYDLRPLSMWIYSRMLLKICMPISVKVYLSRRSLLVLSSHTDSMILGSELLFPGYWSIKFVTKDLQNLLKVLECFCFDCVSESNASFSESNFIYFI